MIWHMGSKHWMDVSFMESTSLRPWRIWWPPESSFAPGCEAHAVEVWWVQHVLFQQESWTSRSATVGWELTPNPFPQASDLSSPLTASTTADKDHNSSLCHGHSVVISQKYTYSQNTPPAWKHEHSTHRLGKESPEDSMGPNSTYGKPWRLLFTLNIFKRNLPLISWLET